MKINFHFTFLTTCLFFFSIAQKASAQLDKIEQSIQTVIDKFPVQTQFSVAIVQHQNVTFLGYLKQKEEIVSISNQNSVFEIGSITKVFTATVLAQLVEDGKLKLSTPLAQITPYLNAEKDSVQLVHLSNHTSGLPRLPSNLEFASVGNPYRNYDANLLEKYLANEISFAQKAGEKYEYSNLGTGLLGFAMGKSQKSSIEKLIQQLVLKKYGLNTTFVNRADVKKLNLVKGINQFGFETSYWDFDALFAAGGILSTASDLAKYIQAHFDISNKALLLTRKATFTISPEMEIGLGWHIIHRKEGQEYIWHNGGSGGFTSSLVMDVRNHKGVVILSNISNFHNKSAEIDGLAMYIIQYL